MAVRYDKKFNQEIRSVINRYNSKVRRLKKENRPDVYVPEMFDKEALYSLKATASSRSEIRRRLKDLEAYSKRGGEKYQMVKGREIATSQLQSIRRYRSSLSRTINKRLRQYENEVATYKGKKQSHTLRQAFSTEYNNLLAKKESLLRTDYLDFTQKQLNEYQEKLIANSLSYSSKASTWQQNYADIILDVGYTYGMTFDEVHELREKLLSLTPEQFDKLSRKEHLIRDIEYIYQDINQLGVDKMYDKEIESQNQAALNTLKNNLDEIISDYK